MKRVWLILLTLLTLGLPLAAPAADRAKLGHTEASLAAQYDRVDGKGAFWVLFQLDIEKGWHTYWRNPGDSGLAPTLDWTVPQGFTASDIVWQPPERQPFGPLMNYGYSGASYHLVRITPPDGFQGGTVPLKVAASWLVCAEECVPEEAGLDLTLPVGDNRRSSKANEIDRLLSSARLPVLQVANTAHDNAGLTLSVPFNGSVKAVYFYPDVSGIIEPAAPQTFEAKDGALTVRMKRGMIDVPPQLTGLLEVEGDGKTYYSVGKDSLVPASDAKPAAPPMPVATLALTLLAAFAGGVILNAMPCVFPVLSLKALAISRAGGEQGRVRADALAYTAGVVVSFLIVGAILLLIKAGGAAVGWGYQMQSPVFVAALIYLLFVVGLNLSGVFDIAINFGGGQSLAGRADWVGSFATGALATAVATPCTAPFMAGALGAALTLPAFAALLIFVALGLGLAFPFLLLSFFPALLKRMPKPGAWMETFRQVLAFPVYLTVVWLLWVLAQQTGADGLAAVLAGLVAVTFAIWAWKRLSLNGLRLAAVVLAVVVTGWSFTVKPPVAASEGGAAFDTAAIDAARASGRPVFVYATAAWCITCKVNERVALETAEVKDAFKLKGIEVVRADWTSADPAITGWLAQFGRSGVPLYVYYPASGDPVVLPQVLTPQLVIENTGGVS